MKEYVSRIEKLSKRLQGRDGAILIVKCDDGWMLHLPDRPPKLFDSERSALDAAGCREPLIVVDV